MDKQRDKESLESEIKRICGDDAFLFCVEFDDESIEGMEIVQKSRHPSIIEARETDDEEEKLKAYLTDIDWVSTDLNISQTLANWRQLPNNAGIDRLWEKTVDSDWNDVLETNMGCA